MKRLLPTLILRRHLAQLLLTLVPLFGCLSVQATVRNWTGLGANGIWGNIANWDTLAPAVNGDSLTFSGAMQLSNTNDYTAITNTGITFSTGGWNLYGNPVTLGGNVTSSTGTNAINVNTVLTATRTMTVTAGQLSLNGVVSGAFGLTTAGSGNLVLAGSNTCSGTITVTAGASAGNVILTNPKGLGTGAVSIPHAGTALGTLKLQLSGVNTIANTFSGFSSVTTGSGAIPQIENVSGTNTITSALTVTGTGGNGLAVQSDAGGLLTLSGVIGTTQNSRLVQFMGAGNGIVNGTIQNGTGTSFPVNKWGTGTWTLNGTNTFTGAVNHNQGTLVLGATGSISNATPVNVAAGAVFDVSAVPGGWTLGGGKTLTGSGIITGSVVTAASGVPVITPGSATTQGTLSFSNNLTLNGGVTLNFNLSSDPTGLVTPSDLIVVGGNLTASGVNTFTLGSYLNGLITDGVYPLISFKGTLTGGAGNFAVTGFPNLGQSGYVITTPTNISLVVTGAQPSILVWRGTDPVNPSYWDIATTANWANGATLTNFNNYDLVTFNDTATNFNVTLQSTIIPGALTVNSTNHYTFSGADISGVLGLTKTGSGTLTLSADNNYTGVTTYGGGTISVASIGNGAATSPLGAAPNVSANQVLNGGALEYTGAGETSARAFSIGANGGTVSVTDPNATLTFNTSGSWVSSGGNSSFTKTGPGTLAFGFQQTLIGTNIIKGGVLKIPTVSLFGTDLTTPLFINGGALDLNGQSLSTKPVFVAGTGDLNISPGTTNGAIVNSGAAQTQGFQFVTLTGDTVFGGNSRWDIRANATASLSTSNHAYNLVKVGANMIALVGVTVDPTLANIDVRQGIFSYELATAGLGNPTNTLTVANGATLDFWNAATPLNKLVVLADYSVVAASNGVSTIVGPVNLLGDGGAGPTFSIASGVTLNLSGVVSGAGTLTKEGPGLLALSATNTYQGATTVSAGKLAVISAQTGSGIITVNDGAALGVTVSGTSQLKTDTLNLGSSLATTTEFTSVSSTTTAPLYATNLVVNGTNTINIVSGTFSAGQIYPLIGFTGLSGGGGFVLGTLPPLVAATLVTNGSSIALNVSAATPVDVWSGRVNANWDIATTTNWVFNATPAKYTAGLAALFDDTALSNTTINVTTTVTPNGIYVNNNAKNYAFSGNSISTTNGLTKLGTGALTLNSANTYTGATTLAAGTLNINHSAALGSGPLTITGGTIDDNGSGPVTLVNNNLQKWNGDFAFTGNQSLNLGTGAVTMNGNRTLAINGNLLTVGGGIGDGGNTYSLTKNGAGTLVLAGTDTYTGVTTVNAGTLSLLGNHGAASGSLVVGPANAGGTLVIASNATVLVASNSVVQTGNTSPAGTTAVYLNVNGARVTNNGTLLASRASYLQIYNGGSWLQGGDMTVQGVGGYTGDVIVATNSTFTYTGTNTIKLNGADGNSGYAYLDVQGTFSTPVAFEQTTTPTTGQGTVILYGGGTLKLTAPVPELNPLLANFSNVRFATAAGCGSIDTAGYDTVINDDITGGGGLTKAGAGVLTLVSSVPISYSNDTRIVGGTLALSNSATLTGTNILIGGGATLDVTGLGSPLLLASGQVLGNLSSTASLKGSVDAAVGPAAISLNYASGTPALTVLNGSLTLSDATAVTVANTGAALGNGSYKLVAAGAGGSVAGTVPASVTVTGHGMGAGGSASLSLTGGELYLGVTGAVSVNTTPTNITAVVSGTNYNLSWPADHTGWRLLVQTNALSVGLSTNWSTWPGSAATNAVSVPISPANPAVFLRLVYP